MSKVLENNRTALAGLALAIALAACSGLVRAQTKGASGDHSAPGPVPVTAKGITPPVPIYRPDPPYTKEARVKNVEGVVILSVVVGAEGAVTDTRLKSGPLAGLEKSALQTVRTWRFQPALRDGKPIAVRVTVQIGFRLFGHGKAVFIPPPGYQLPPQPLEGVIPPKPIYTPAPKYTPKARRVKLEGQVTVDVSVDKKGRVTHAEEVGRKLGMGLDKQAIRTARNWKFEPATRNGKPIKDKARIFLIFKL